MTAKKLNRRQACWSLYLARFDFRLVHCPERCIGKPDHGNRASNNEDVVLLRPELLAIWALEGVQLEGPEKDILREIRQENQKEDQEKPVAKAAKELRQALSKMVRSAEWSEDEGLLCFRGKIYTPQNPDLRR